MTDEIETEGFTRHFAGKRGEFLCRRNDNEAEMARRAGRRRAYELAGIDDFTVGSAARKLRAA
jgi:hypothetical protein